MAPVSDLGRHSRMIMLWLVLDARRKAFDRERESRSRAISCRRSPRLSNPKTEQPKTEQPKTELPRLPAAGSRRPDQKPGAKGDPRSRPPDTTEERQATAARLAWMLNFRRIRRTSLAALRRDQIQSRQEHIAASTRPSEQSVWVAPGRRASSPGFCWSCIRVAPLPTAFSVPSRSCTARQSSLACAPSVESAKRRCSQCQPNATLPADRYKTGRCSI